MTRPGREALRRAWLAAVATVAVALPMPRVAADATVAGLAGTDTSLPATPSAATKPGRGIFAGLQVTVNQTADLVNQAVSVTWSGAAPTQRQFYANFLQIFQCWGNDDGTNPANPGPPPEQCEFGGEPITSGHSFPDGAAPSNVDSRAISQDSWAPLDPAQGFPDPETGKLWKPFRAVDGTVVDAETRLLVGGDHRFVGVSWQNPFFDVNTTNEEPWGKTYADGTGSVLFRVDTGLEARGLGCGQKVELHPDGSTSIPRCWLVIVPRGSAAQENPPDVAPYVATSPLAPTPWRNRIAFPLQVNPVDSPCAIGADQRRIVGSELAAPAVVNWQPTLCSTPGSAPYAYAAIPDGRAGQEVSGGATGAAGMAVVTRPLDPAAVDPANPVVYAPLTLSGLVIGFNIERRTLVQRSPDDSIRGTRIAHINLTPRLVAKLLTESYRKQLVQGGQLPFSYGWVKANPGDVLADPDFVQFNPEFQLLGSGTPRTASGLLVEQPQSDGAYELWRWILADREAADWLAGAADPWGMNVNPRYSTNPGINPTGSAFARPIPPEFRKSDPYCFRPDDQVGTPPQAPRPLCIADWSPYALNLQFAAQETRAANDGARLTHDPQNPNDQTPSTYWLADGPQILGNRSILTVTDAASAARYGLQTASLSRAGDDVAARSFASPDAAGIGAAEKAMVAGSVPEVLEPSPATAPPGAYPLAMLTYAATTPRTLDARARHDYAAFIDYAAGDGQIPGLDFGHLPPGFVPLSDTLRAQAKSVAGTIRNGDPAPSSTTTTAPTATTAPSRGTSHGGPAGSTAVTSPQGSVTPQAAAPKVAPGPRGPLALAGSIARTVAQGIGSIRYLLPISVVLALAAGLGAWILSQTRRRGAARHDSERKRKGLSLLCPRVFTQWPRGRKLRSPD